MLGTGGWTWVDVILFVCFAFGTPWTVLGFWNALIGLWLLHFRKDAMAEVAPYAAAGDQPTPIGIKTAIFMTVRNEDPGRAILRLKTVKASVDATGEGAQLQLFRAERHQRSRRSPLPRKRRSRPGRPPIRMATASSTAGASYNTAFKAGNVHDFCERWGKDYTLMLPLDADSLMAGPEIVRLVRMMQAHPKIGILQSLVVGMPSSSGFARIFQFGMRHGMRSYTMGQAWWVGDCGPFWGHNALVRIKPFHEQCDLPILPGKPPLGGHVLSHDQVEATLMRRAGYEVRVLPEERGSWEENPPTMLEFAQRDVRWCQGNMQYIKLLEPAGPLSHEPLPAGVGDPDVHRHSRLDADDRAAAGGSVAGAGHCGFSGRSRHRPLHHVLHHVPDAEDRRPHRRDADARRRCALRRLAALHRRGGDRARVLVPAGRGLDHPHVDLHDRPGVREVGGVGRAVARRATASPGRTRRATCGRRRCSASSCAARCC